MRIHYLQSLSTLILVVAVNAATTAEKDAQDYDKKSYKEEDYDKKAYKDAASIFAMEYLPIGHLRTDPILSRECLSDHVHTFYGPPMLHPSVTFDELRSAGNTREATSGNVLENQSLYWCALFPIVVVQDSCACIHFQIATLVYRM